jgi:hypothetical protein
MADFDYNKTYGPEGGSFVVDHPGGSVTVPSGKVLKFELVPVATIVDPPAKQEAKVVAKPVKAKATVKPAKRKGSK